MIRLLLILAAIATASSPANANDRRYAVADFDRVIVEGPYVVRLIVGRTSSAVATGSQRSLDAVTVDVQGTTLRVRRNRQTWAGYPGGPAAEPATITLTTRALRSARVVGAGSLAVEGAKGIRLDLVVDGGGRISASGLDADNLSLVVRGAGTVALQGNAETLTADVQGSASLQGAALSAETATITAATSGDIALTARRTASVTANGLGRVTIGGSPACTVRGLRASDVTCGPAR